MENEPDFVFLAPAIFRSINKTSPNCLGEPILKSLPASLKIFSFKIKLSFSKSLLRCER